MALRSVRQRQRPQSQPGHGCFICGSDEVNDLELGEFHRNGKIAVHYFCLLLSSGLVQNGDDDQGIFGFLPKDIRAEVERCKRLKCMYCKKIGANIGCCAPKCRHTFHTACGLQSDCLMQFEDPYPSYCHEHVATAVLGGGSGRTMRRHKPNEMCTVCYDTMGDFNVVQSVQSPCCKRSWFHKRCLMNFAKTAGYFFKCPMCNNEDDFRNAVKLRGVFVPDRDAAWELEPNAFAELLERPETCEASECVCPDGRDHESAKYKMLRCETCGSHCVHDKCLSGTSGSVFRCSDCDVQSNETAVAMRTQETSTGNESDETVAWDSPMMDSPMDMLRIIYSDHESDDQDKIDKNVAAGASNKGGEVEPKAASQTAAARRRNTDSDHEAGGHQHGIDEKVAAGASANGGEIVPKTASQTATARQRITDSDHETDHLTRDPSSSALMSPVKGAPVQASSSLSDVMFVETKNDPILLSSGDEEDNIQIYKAEQENQPNGRRHQQQPQQRPNCARAIPIDRKAMKRERCSADGSAKDEADGSSIPPQSKRIRRALETMKNQSKITSFFNALGGPLKQTATAAQSAGATTTTTTATTSNSIPPTGVRIKAEPLK